MSQVAATQDPNQRSNCRPDKPRGRKHKQPGHSPAAKGHSGSSENTPPQSTANSVVPSPSGGMFGPSKGNIEIKNGEFNATGRDHINMTTVIELGPGHWKPRNKKRSCRPRTVHVNEVGSEAPRIPERTSCDIYYDHLGSKGRGSPLYIPGPNQRLPEEYKRTGMRIGDVGMISKQGHFEFLFNICLAANHPINRGQVPDNFQQLLAEPDIQEHFVFDKGSSLSSASITTSYPEGDSSGLKFKSSACEGALLTMPMGSSAEDAGNQEMFRKYMETHLQDWYRYVKIVRGRSVKNGGVRLVTGYDKASLWGMAVFADSTAKEDSLLLEFQPVTEAGAGERYKWKHSGSADVKSGPGAREVENLRRRDPGPERRTYENQCLFVRTFNGTLQENVWKKLAAEFGEVEVDESTFRDDASSQSSGRGSTRSSGTTTQSTSGSSANAPGVRMALATIANIPIGRATTLASVSPRETTLACHPSDTINKMLLKLNPKAQMAITHDDDWISVIREDDCVLPSPDQLCARITESLVVRQDKEVVFLENREYPSCSGVPVDEMPIERDRTNLISPAACDIYYDHVGSKGRGSPLYIPGPNQRLPEEYKRTGMRIGDVGIISNQGHFKFPFNICHAGNHPINCGQVPDNFQQLLAEPDIQEHLACVGENHIARASVKKSYLGEDSSDLRLTSSNVWKKPAEESGQVQIYGGALANFAKLMSDIPWMRFQITATPDSNWLEGERFRSVFHRLTQKTVKATTTRVISQVRDHQELLNTPVIPEGGQDDMLTSPAAEYLDFGYHDYRYGDSIDEPVLQSKAGVDFDMLLQIPPQTPMLDSFGEEEDQLDELPPNPPERDLIEAKRRQNAAAARRSRKRKLEQMQTLERSVKVERHQKEVLQTRLDMLVGICRSAGVPGHTPCQSYGHQGNSTSYNGGAPTPYHGAPPPTEPYKGTPPTKPYEGAPPPSVGYKGVPPTKAYEGTPTKPYEGTPPAKPYEVTPPTKPYEGTPPTKPYSGA